MKKSLALFISSLVLLIVLASIGLIFIDKGKKTLPATVPQEISEEENQELNFPQTTYTNQTYKYLLMIPTTWEVNETDVTILSPKVGTIQYGSTEKVTIIVTDAGIVEDKLSTIEEFNKYYDLPAEELHNERYYKMDLTTLDGEKAIILLDKMAPGQESETAWSLIAWARKNNQNIFINAQGEQELTDTDIQLMDTLVNSFKWLPN